MGHATGFVRENGVEEMIYNGGNQEGLDLEVFFMEIKLGACLVREIQS